MYFVSMPLYTYLIFDEAHAFLSSIMQNIYKGLCIKIETISPNNYCYLKNRKRHQGHM